jgi:hypothetical protein
VSWLKWEARLRGEKVLTFPQPDEEDEGYYRTLITEPGVNAKTGQRNGKTIPVMWGEPVAYFMFGGKLCGVLGSNHDMTENEVTDLWTYVVRYPISEDLYRDVAEKGKPWPDLPPKAVAEIPAADREVAKSDNAPIEAIPPDKMHAEAIDAAICAAPTAVKSDAEASIALGSKNRIAELRLAADKAGKAIYEPMYRTYTAEQKKWSPMIARATAKEKELNTAILSFRESERLRILKEQAEAEQRQRELDDANARAADRAIGRGEPEHAPEVEEVATPAPVAPIVATYGSRGLREELKKFAIIENKIAICHHFIDNPELVALLEKLATTAIRSGIIVAGTSVREGLI